MENLPEFLTAADAERLSYLDTAPEEVAAFKNAMQTVNVFNTTLCSDSGLPKYFEPSELKEMKTRLEEQTAPAFTRAGVRLSRLKNAVSYNTPEGIRSTGQVDFELADGGALAGFLGGIKQGNADYRLREDVTRIAESFFRTVCRSITYGNTDSQTFEAHISASAIVSGLENVGMADYDITRRLAGLTKAFDGYYVEAYAEAETLGLFSEPGSPASLRLLPSHAASVELLMRNWTSVYRVIRELESQPEAEQILTQLIQGTWNHLLYMQSLWDDNRHELERKRGSGFAVEVDNIISSAFAYINSVTKG